jgi:hypothetical protein
VAIWILDQNTLRGATDFHHRFSVWDAEREVRLTSHLEIHVLELARWLQRPDPEAPAGLLRWMRFFSEAETWGEVPREISHPALESAMSVLHEFQVNRGWNDAYRSRRDALRVQITQDNAMKRALEGEARALEGEARALEREARDRAEKETERAEKDRERADRQRAQGEVETLRERLRALGIDPEG